MQRVKNIQNEKVNPPNDNNSDERGFFPEIEEVRYNSSLENKSHSWRGVVLSEIPNE